MSQAKPAAPAQARIYGKDTWPYTTAAREDFAKRKVPFIYRNVVQDKEAMKEMLVHTKGGRDVPVIVEGTKVTVGFAGGSWGV